MDQFNQFDQASQSPLSGTPLLLPPS